MNAESLRQNTRHKTYSKFVDMTTLADRLTRSENTRRSVSVRLTEKTLTEIDRHCEEFGVKRHLFLAECVGFALDSLGDSNNKSLDAPKNEAPTPKPTSKAVLKQSKQADKPKPKRKSKAVSEASPPEEALDDLDDDTEDELDLSDQDVDNVEIEDLLDDDDLDDDDEDDLF